jgi:hypothetical protein
MRSPALHPVIPAVLPPSCAGRLTRVTGAPADGLRPRPAPAHRSSLGHARGPSPGPAVGGPPAPCARRRFPARLPALLAPSARHPTRRIAVLPASGLALGGPAGAPARAHAWLPMVRERRGADLEAWRAEARPRGIAALARVARGRPEDLPAAPAGLTRAWSPGPVAGPLPHLPGRKRQGDGRTGVALLRQRVLPAA